MVSCFVFMLWEESINRKAHKVDPAPCTLHPAPDILHISPSTPYLLNHLININPVNISQSI